MEKVFSEREGSVLRVWIQRPQVHNAFDEEVIAGLTAAIEGAASDSSVRALVIGSRGKSFSAGADLTWMRRAADKSQADNERDAGGLARLLRALAECPCATIARVQGTALGGGLGLIAACDLAVAAERARFGFSEVKLGLIPAVISPHVVAKIGPGRARALFVTGTRFGAAEAERFGLLSAVVADEAALDQEVEGLLEQILANAPGAVAASKVLVRQVSTLPAEQVDAYTATQIAARRACEEGREGIAAFLEKRCPAWVDVKNET
jgi:methylglutaconyl-CoA hydratase